MTAAQTYELQQQATHTDSPDSSLLAQIAAAQKEIGGVVFYVAEDNLPELEKRLKALNRKAERIGAEPITLTRTEEVGIESYVTDTYSTRALKFQHRYVILTGTTPKIEGFTMIAALAHTDAGTLVHRVPMMMLGDEKIYSEINLSEYTDAEPHCDHCNKIRSRNNTYIMHEEATGEIKQIGRTCLRDYTGSNNPEQIAKLLEYVWEWMRGASAHGEQPIVPTRDFLAHAAVLARGNNGYYRKGLGWNAWSNYFDAAQDRRDKRGPLYVTPVEGDYDLADRTLAWGRDMEPQTNEFMENLRKTISVDAVADKTQGILGYAPTAYQKATDQLAAKKAEAEQVAADFIGSPGVRLTRKLTVERIRQMASAYAEGYVPMYIMKDEFGNPVKWFASSWSAGMKEGGTYLVKATVKKHDDHEKFGKSTLITRAKVEEIISEPAEEAA